MERSIVILTFSTIVFLAVYKKMIHQSSRLRDFPQEVVIEKKMAVTR
jgi:hypothetical protein